MTIAHCRTRFLPVSEVFIENQIFESESVKPIVLTCELENAHKNAHFCPSQINKNNDLKIFSFCNNSLLHLFKKMSKREGDYFSNVIREIGAQLLHVHFGTDAWYFMKLKKLAKIPMVVSFYGYDAYKFPKMFFGIGKILLRKVFKCADAVVVPSEHMKKYLVDLGCSENKINIIPWGVKINDQLSMNNDQCTTEYDEKSVSKNKADKTVKFISLGRMVEKKGQIYLIKAFKKVLDSGINAELTIIGQGPLKNKLVGAIDKFGISAIVKFIDKLSNQEVVQTLMSHNIYVQPSLVSRNGDQEGIPTAIMEACSCQLPIISTNHAGIPEIVQNNVSGILVPERDSEKLAEAMIRLAKDSELCKKFGANGKKIASDKYNVIKQNKKLEELYEREINRFNSNI
ncbi:colanic acid biosynthesis glycosyltransferase WcaL [bacterium]|nr:MAG: colanic acid biosynthesis glycosyltransferase WcaL [bacterium]